MKLGAIAALIALALTACGSTNTPTGSTQKPPPTASLKPLDKVGTEVKTLDQARRQDLGQLSALLRQVAETNEKLRT